MSELERNTAELVRYVNQTPELISLLYDLDLLPEQLDKPSHDWNRMLIIASFYRTRHPNLKELLVDAVVALNDWLHLYAGEHCDLRHVEETWKRISARGGTVAYITDVRTRLEKALKEQE